MYFGLHVKYLSHFLKNIQISNFMKICPMGTELFLVDRWTEMTMLIITFCSFANLLTKKATRRTYGLSHHSTQNYALAANNDLPVVS